MKFEMMVTLEAMKVNDDNDGLWDEYEDGSDDFDGKCLSCFQLDSWKVERKQVVCF